MHPLGQDLSKFSDEELYKKQSELSKRFTQAHRFGPAGIIPQLQILMQDYQEEAQRRQARAMKEMQEKLNKGKDDKSLRSIIDIQ